MMRIDRRALITGLSATLASRVTDTAAGKSAFLPC
jgi:hypothetical protein